MTYLVCRDLLVIMERQRYVIESLDETFLGARIYVAAGRPAERVRDRLRGEVHAQFVPVMPFDGREDRLDLLGLEDYRQEAVLQRVVAEDVGEGGRDHRLEAEVGKRPHRVLARAAASEVGPGDQDRGAFEARLVEHVALVRLIAPVVKEPLAQAAANHGL